MISVEKNSQASGFNERVSDNTKGSLPDYHGSVLFEIKEIIQDKFVGTFNFNGHIYDGKITTNLNRKKINSLKGKKYIQAKIVGHNDSYYILRC